MFGNGLYGIMLMPVFGKKKGPCFWFSFADLAVALKLIVADKIFWRIAGNRNAGYNKILVLFGKRDTPRFWLKPL